MGITKNILRSIVILIIFTLILGVAYPFAMFGIGKLFFPKKTNGSLIEKNGVIIGSSLIAQDFSSDIYFHGRPTLSSPSNAPTSEAMIKRISARIETAQTYNLHPDTAVPINLVCDSGSTVDPDISPEGAYYQIARISKATGIQPDRLSALVYKNTKEKLFGVFGEKTVNVLLLNLDLNSLLHEKR